MRARVFAAFELPPDIKQTLAELMADFRARVPPGAVRWVRPEGVHLTLKFYGEVPVERLPAIQAGLSQAAAGAPPIRLSIEGLGAFPGPQRPQVIWLGLTGDLKPLNALQAAVEAMSARLGYEAEARGFRPHLTLGRVSRDLRPPEQRQVQAFLAQAQVPHAGDFQAEALSLMRSELQPGGAIYSALYVAPLGHNATAARPRSAPG